MRLTVRLTRMSEFFADTYALIELSRGNPNYRRFITEKILTSKFNIAELYYYALRTKGISTAEAYMQAYGRITTPITTAAIRQGMKFKFQHKSEKLSYADCIGYAAAAELGIKFLTGDNKFENKDNVEFVN